MADIHTSSIKPVGSSPVSVAPQVTIKPQITPVNNNPEVQKKKVDTTRKKDDVKTKEYGPVIATSEDGDTVRVKMSEDDINSAKSSYSFKAAFEQQPKPEIQDFKLPESTSSEKDTSSYEPPKETSSNWSPKPTSLASYTEAQLRKMYQNGDISETKYENELKSRSERKETIAKETEAISTEVAKDIVQLSEMENTEKALDLLEYDEAQPRCPEMRADILQTI